MVGRANLVVLVAVVVVVHVKVMTILVNRRQASAIASQRKPGRVPVRRHAAVGPQVEHSGIAVQDCLDSSNVCFRLGSGCVIDVPGEQLLRPRSAATMERY